MYETGITRKIDGLGRIVIPKEIRERFNIKENDYLEFLLGGESILIKKYSKIGKLQALAQELTDTLNMFLHVEVFIADKDHVLAYSGVDKKKYLNQNVSPDIIKAIKRRECLFEPYMKDLKIIDGDVINCSYINETIVANYEEAGLICLYRKDKSVDKQDLKIVNIVSSFLTKYLEE